MPIATVAPAIASIGGTASGITSAKDPPPASIEGAQLPCLFVFTGEARYDWDVFGNPDVGLEIRDYRVQVAVVPTTQATPETRETRCRPLIIAVRNVLVSNPQLGGTQYVQRAIVVSDSGVAILPEYGGKYIGFEIRLQVEEIFAKTYASGE